jgi:RNA binding exosome subunit
MEVMQVDSINARILARRDTTANWNALRSFVPLRGEIIIYTDHGQMDDGYGNRINVPGIKIGDGNAYLIDLPFVGNDQRYAILQELRAHTGDTAIHVTMSEKDFWNNKLNYTINDGNLTFNRN